MKIGWVCGRAVCATLAVLLSLPVLAAEQAYPSKPIRLVVPFPAGGSLDVVARAIGQKLTEAWGQPVVIDNRPGAGGNIGADLVAKSAPDGYTILEGALSTHAVNVSLYTKMPYDPIKDFAPITLVAVTPNVLVLNASYPVNSVPFARTILLRVPTVDPFLAAKMYIVAFSPTGIDFRVQPRSSMTRGGSVYATHWTTVPFASVTSMATSLCGLPQ